MAAVTVAATQFACGPEPDANVAAAERLVRRAAAAGARIVLLQELFETPYFCKDQRRESFGLARPADGHPTLERMSRLAAGLRGGLPVRVFERARHRHDHSVIVVQR